MNAVRQVLYASLLVAILLIGLSETQPAYAARMEQQYVTSVLKLMEGDWYDASGACILQIKGG